MTGSHIMSEPGATPIQIFICYGRDPEGKEIAERLEADLSRKGYRIWRDPQSRANSSAWSSQIGAAIGGSRLVVAVLTPHAVRDEMQNETGKRRWSVCLDEIEYARFAHELPIVPVMVVNCPVPLAIYRLQYIDMRNHRDSPGKYDQCLQELIESINDVLSGKTRYRRWDDRLQTIDFASFLYSKRRDFHGRDWLFRKLDEWRADSGRGRTLLITGDPGVGKSAIVAQLVHLNPNRQVLAYHCCRADTPETLRPARFIAGLAGMIASQIESYAAQLDNPTVEKALSLDRRETDPASAFEEGILAPLHEVPPPPGGPRYILIDALDEALMTREGKLLLSLLAPSRLNRLPDWLRIVVTTREDPDVLRQLSGLHAEKVRADDPENLKDVEGFIVFRLNQPELHKRLADAGVSVDEALRKLLERSGGNFLWAEQALEGLEAEILQVDHLDELPPGLTGLYFRFFERHFPDDASYEPARRVLEVVTAAREPLTGAEIAEAAGLNPIYEVSPVFNKLSAYLPVRDGKRAMYHQSFTDWLTSTTDPHPAGRFLVDVSQGDKRLAEWALSNFYSRTEQ